VLTALERRQFARPGRMVDIGGHQLHVQCTGAAPPRVVLEAPLGSLSAHWQGAQSRLAPHVGVCSYDRSGLGWSERGDAPFSTDEAVRELDALLTQIGATGPTILVGEEFGAAVAVAFARRHPDRVAALVLVALPTPTARPSTRSPWLARIGLLRALDWLRGPGPWAAAPREGVEIVRAFGYRPDHLTRSAAELASWNALVDPQTEGLPADLRVRLVDRPWDARQYVDDVVAAVLDLAR
jgi:pimeloyl-ACP methyl ester carboxylesterase